MSLVKILNFVIFFLIIIALNNLFFGIDSKKNFLSLQIENQELTSKWCNNYENNAGGVGIVTDSWGMISIFLSNGDASKLLNCKDGSKVTIKAESLTKRLNLK